MQEWILSLPLILISGFAIIAMLLIVFTGKRNAPVMYFSLFSLIVTGLSSAYTLFIPNETIKSAINPDSIFANMLLYGSYSAFFDIVFCLAGVLTILASRNYLHQEEYEHKEYYVLILYAIAGMMFISHSNNLLMLFIGIETMSVTFYILAGYFRFEERSVESSLKYFLLGAFATGFLVYGIALLYGATGTLDLSIIHLKVTQGIVQNTYLIIGLGLLFIGLAFKVAAFPFHMWAPDVYEGAPTPITGFMSTAGKAAALVAFIIVAKNVININSIYPEIANGSSTMTMIIAVLSAATMLVGNIIALVQKNIKRMLAYSSIAHAGYLLMGIVANNPRGWAGIVFYATVYLFMQIGAFIIIGIIEKKSFRYLNLSDYSGLSKTKPVLAALMALFMFSLAGIPPMAGFFGKYYLFVAAIEAGYLWLTIIAVISSIISMYFYIGLIIYMYFNEPGEDIPQTNVGLSSISLAISSIGILFFGIFPHLLIDFASKLF